MSRREARIQRELAQELKKKEKSSRLVARLAADAPKDRVVRTGADPGSIYNTKMTWTAEYADRAEAWSWGQPRDWGDDSWKNIILPKLESYQAQLWKEIEAATTDNGRRMHHPMPVEIICDESQSRLIAIDRVEDEIYRFRLGNRPRLWGFRVVSEFQILWYDPEHNIYPADPE